MVICRANFSKHLIAGMFYGVLHDWAYGLYFSACDFVHPRMPRKKPNMKAMRRIFVLKKINF
jgi:hypothetical protein